MKSDQGLTLLEVLAAVALLSLLAAALTPLLRSTMQVEPTPSIDACSFAMEVDAAILRDSRSLPSLGAPIVLARGDALGGTWFEIAEDDVVLCRWLPPEKPDVALRRVR